MGETYITSDFSNHVKPQQQAKQYRNTNLYYSFHCSHPFRFLYPTGGKGSGTGYIAGKQNYEKAKNRSNFLGCSIYPLKLIYNPLSQVHHIAYVQLLVFIVIHLLLIRLLVHNPLGQRHHIQHVLLLVLIQII